MSSRFLILKHPQTDIVKTAPLGYSWTTFFFGFLVPVYRHDWIWAAVMLIPTFLTYGFSSIIFAVFYNRVYAKKLLRQGYLLYRIEGNLSKSEIDDYLGQELPRFQISSVDSLAFLRELERKHFDHLNRAA